MNNPIRTLAHGLFVGAILASSIGVSALNAAPAKRTVRPAARAAEPAICASMHEKYETIGKKLAWAKVRGDVGGAAAEMRAAQEANALMSEAGMMVDLMRSNGCRAPTAPPNRDAYLVQAARCQIDIYRAASARLRGEAGMPAQPAACVMERWQPE